MAKFSDRIGATQPRRQLQVDDMDTELRNALWNWVTWALQKDRPASYHTRYEYWLNLVQMGLWDEVFHLTVDEIPHHDKVPDAIKHRFMSWPWHQTYNIVEFVLNQANKARGQYDRRDHLETRLNSYLEREMSGYRAINGQLAPITNAAEIATIEQAAGPRNGFELAAEHINTALSLLSKKPDPDYRNSIKESICAVETVTRTITGDNSGGIDKALAMLEKRGLHPALKQGFSKLYAYTSDDDGIRHAMVEEPTAGFREAKFMLVACSAFVNYLISL